MKANKFKPHKGLKKRVKITRNGQVKHDRAGGRHRKSRHTAQQNRQLRRPEVAHEVERRRAQSMLHFRIRRPEARPEEVEAATD
ncbi:MAG: large ribosomal subunit protein bL35 [Planctomycetota bacterium]